MHLLQRLIEFVYIFIVWNKTGTGKINLPSIIYFNQVVNGSDRNFLTVRSQKHLLKGNS